MAHPTNHNRARQIRDLRSSFAQADGLPFADLLTADRVDSALAQEGACWREKLFTPLLTLWTFLAQVLSPDGSCRAALAQLLAYLTATGQDPGTPDTGAYCKARARLPDSLLPRLARDAGRDLHDRVPDAWLWKGRRVKVADGTTVSMPDTPANRAEFPPHGEHKPGLGFPIARVVVVFCLACGSVIDAALGVYRGKQTGETALLRGLDEALEPGDVLLADRYYGGWFDLALRKQRGVDVVVRLHQKRKADFRRGRRLGHRDHVVNWEKPQRPDWMSQEEYEALPAEREVREVGVRVEVPGFRTRSLVVVTTLLDAAAYPARELAGLYRLRWHAELDLRSLKGPLGLDVLRCKSPAMVRKEFWARLLVYNLIRGVMAEAASASGVKPRELSFKGAAQAVREFGVHLVGAEGVKSEVLRGVLLRWVAGSRVGDRPDRVEPRARKRRPKKYANLTVPREEARKRRDAKG